MLTLSHTHAVCLTYHQVTAGIQDDSDEDGEGGEAGGDGKASAKAAAEASSSDSGSDGEGGEGKKSMSKKQRKMLSRLKIAELKQLCERPDVVEVWDVTSPDPQLLVFLKVRASMLCPRVEAGWVSQPCMLALAPCIITTCDHFMPHAYRYLLQLFPLLCPSAHACMQAGGLMAHAPTMQLTPLPHACLQGYRNTVSVPRHWSQKRKYLQGKRGIEKPPFKLPDFIDATGIGNMRQAYSEKEEGKKLKQKQRDRMAPKMGKMDINYAVGHWA